MELRTIVNIIPHEKFCPKRLFSINRVHLKSFRKWYQEFWSRKSNCPPYMHFTQIGDPVLRSKAAPVPEEMIKSKEVGLITKHMIEVMRKFNCVGIAAPQLGVSLRIIAMEFPHSFKKNYKQTIYENRKMSLLPLTILINPTLTVTNYDKHKHPEGCMSIRGYAAEVERYDAVTLTGFDELGARTEVKLSGWNARVAQHEMDHLDGKLYIDHMDRSTFVCTCWEAINRNGGRVEMQFYK